MRLPEEDESRIVALKIAIGEGVASGSAAGHDLKEEKMVGNLQGCQADKHIIFYRIRENGKVETVSILPERMDWKNRISEYTDLIVLQIVL